jgi:AcrR family transcriptional regulator
MTGIEVSSRRERILTAAAIEIGERGVDSARMADIAERAGVSLGLVQHYFRHRHRLLAEVIRQQSQRIAVTWRNLVDPQSPPLDRLVDYLALCVPPDPSTPDAADWAPGWGFWIEMWSKAHRDPSVREEVPGIYESFQVPFTRAIEDGVAAGIFHLRLEVADLVDLLTALIDGLAVQTVVGCRSEQQTLDLLVRTLCHELGLDEDQTARAQARAVFSAQHVPLPAHATG